MFSTYREYCLLPEKQMRSHCNFMHTFEEKTFLQMQRHERIIWSKLNFVWYLHLILFLNVTIRDQHEPWNFYFLQTPYLQRYADVAAGKGAPLFNCFDFVGGPIARTCRPVLNVSVVQLTLNKSNIQKLKHLVRSNKFVGPLNLLTLFR